MNPDLSNAFDRYKNELLSFLNRRTLNAEWANALLQQLFDQLETIPADFLIVSRRAFLYRMANNLLTDFFNSPARREGTQHKTEQQGEADAALNRRMAVLYRAVESLPPKCIEVYKLRCYAGLDYDQIADRVGISRSMVEKHLRWALQHCQQCLADNFM